jgi:hypothetical protein
MSEEKSQKIKGQKIPLFEKSGQKLYNFKPL